MTDAAVVGRIEREYRLDPVSLRRSYGSVSSDQVGYQGVSRDGGAVLVRAYRADMPLPPPAGWPGPGSVTDWLQGRAATLAWLAARGYPAPRVVATRSGDPVGVAGTWLTWATGLVPGRGLEPGEAGLLGAALGRLHALGAPWESSWPLERGPGLASWHPATAIPAALRRLDAVAGLLPGEWRPLHRQFRATLLAVRRAAAGLPEAVVHGAAWPGNALVTPAGEVVLAGWEDGGLGLPVVDLGQCLLEIHLDPGLPAGRPEPWLIEPDPERVAAVLDGYTRWRPVAGAELEILAEAIRFCAACAGAVEFERAFIGGVHDPAMDARLGRLRNRIAVSQAVAGLAQRHLGRR